HEGAARATVARRPGPAARLGSYALAGGLVGAAGLVAAGLMALLHLADPGMVFLAAVLLTAVLAGLGPSILAAVLGLLVYDFLFVDPRFTLTVAKPQDILSMFMFLVVAVLTSELTARVRDQAEAARRREERTAALYAFAREIAGSADLDDLVRVILDHVARLFGTGAALLLPDAGRLVLLDPDGVVEDVNEVACAILGFGRTQAVGVRFDDLGTHHPHYLRLREAVREFLAHPEHEHDAVELALFLRGRDHYYVLRPTP